MLRASIYPVERPDLWPEILSKLQWEMEEDNRNDEQKSFFNQFTGKTKSQDSENAVIHTLHCDNVNNDPYFNNSTKISKNANSNNNSNKSSNNNGDFIFTITCNSFNNNFISNAKAEKFRQFIISPINNIIQIKTQNSNFEYTVKKLNWFKSNKFDNENNSILCERDLEEIVNITLITKPSYGIQLQFRKSPRTKKLKRMFEIYTKNEEEQMTIYNILTKLSKQRQ
eukprot:Pgem_evm1s4119